MLKKQCTINFKKNLPPSSYVIYGQFAKLFGVGLDYTRNLLRIFRRTRQDSSSYRSLSPRF